ncbi:hypothetical protein REPUB_Repub08aG0138900 [Reevesia pubescens]
MMNEKVGLMVADSLRDVEEVDVKEGSMAWGRFLRVQVNINITTALKRVTKISASDGTKKLVMFWCEKLPDFCYVVGNCFTRKVIVLWCCGFEGMMVLLQRSTTVG